MTKPAGLALARLFFAVVVLSAIITQLASLVGLGIFSPVGYFSYFTIESNLIAAACLLIGAARWRSPRSRVFDLARGGAVVYMTVTGVVFTLLLKNVDVDTQLAWVNSVVHELMPLVIIADWLLDPPATRLKVRDGLVWLVFPAVWIVYTLIRGAIVNKYPYPFVNPGYANQGYGAVTLYCVGILVGMLVISWLVVVMANAVGRGERQTEVTV